MLIISYREFQKIIISFKNFMKNHHFSSQISCPSHVETSQVHYIVRYSAIKQIVSWLFETLFYSGVEYNDKNTLDEFFKLQFFVLVEQDINHNPHSIQGSIILYIHIENYSLLLALLKTHDLSIPLMILFYNIYFLLHFMFKKSQYLCPSLHVGLILLLLKNVFVN